MQRTRGGGVGAGTREADREPPPRLTPRGLFRQEREHIHRAQLTRKQRHFGQREGERAVARRPALGIFDQRCRLGPCPAVERIHRIRRSPSGLGIPLQPRCNQHRFQEMRRSDFKFRQLGSPAATGAPSVEIQEEVFLL